MAEIPSVALTPVISPVLAIASVASPYRTGAMQISENPISRQLGE